MRIGTGYDVHRLVEGRDLVLGGVRVPFEKGLLGHSDADVLTHALMDALLGAAGLGDIGHQFPDTDPAYAGADSLGLLTQVQRLIAGAGYRVHNVDAVVIAQRPKLAPYLPEMRGRLAAVLGCAVEAVGLKATTTEGLGFTGRGEGIAAQAVCLLEER
jgi:2-C-methyl-D-erythritol 2,4-cyclodiphosphate synthase